MYTIIAPSLGSAGVWSAAGAAGAIGLATLAAAGARRPPARRARRTPRLWRGWRGPALLFGAFLLNLAMLRLGGDPFASGAGIGAAVLAVTFLGFASGVARMTAPRRRALAR